MQAGYASNVIKNALYLQNRNATSSALILYEKSAH